MVPFINRRRFLQGVSATMPLDQRSVLGEAPVKPLVVRAVPGVRKGSGVVPRTRVLSTSAFMASMLSPREAAEENEFVMSIVSNDDASRQIWLEPRGYGPGTSVTI